jgi:hypothetical protein
MFILFCQSLNSNFVTAKLYLNSTWEWQSNPLDYPPTTNTRQTFKELPDNLGICNLILTKLEEIFKKKKLTNNFSYQHFFQTKFFSEKLFIPNCYLEIFFLTKIFSPFFFISNQTFFKTKIFFLPIFFSMKRNKST